MILLLMLLPKYEILRAVSLMLDLIQNDLASLQSDNFGDTWRYTKPSFDSELY